MSADNRISELLACPFCAATEKLEIVKPNPLYTSLWVVYCDNCGCCGGADVTQQDAANCWNTRNKRLQEVT